jgi:hypothetical protein
MRTYLLIGLLVLGGCRRGEREAAPGTAEIPGDAVATSPDTAPADAEHAALERFRAQLPPEVLVRGNACPFECCVYGEWVADTIIPMYREPRRTGTPAFTVPKGTSLRADSGAVFVTGIALAIVEDTVADSPNRLLLPGDTLVLLDPIGEGYWTAWRRGEILESVPPFFESWWHPKQSGRLIGEPLREWWARTTVNGRTAWFRPDLFRVRGADACG